MAKQKKSMTVAEAGRMGAKARGQKVGASTRKRSGSGNMTVSEAGRMGGLKGSKALLAKFAGDEEARKAHFQKIGSKGGQKVRQLVEAGRAALAK